MSRALGRRKSPFSKSLNILTHEGSLSLNTQEQGADNDIPSKPNKLHNFQETLFQSQSNSG